MAVPKDVPSNRGGYGATTITTTAAAAVATPIPNVQVIAPATLQSGYTFDAIYDGVTFTVIVPDGGVNKGQRFIVPFNPHTADGLNAAAAVATASVVADVSPDGKISNYTSTTTAAAAADNLHKYGSTGSNNDNAGKQGRQQKQQQERGHIPTGIWRDGLCDCFRLGSHPHCWNAWCFKPCLVGQLLTRMRMTWLGQHENTEALPAGDDGTNNKRDDRWRDSFRNLVIVAALYYALKFLTISDDDDDLSDKFTLNSFLTIVFGIYMLYIVMKLRATMRHVYHIREESFLCMYDVCPTSASPEEGMCGNFRGNHDESGLPLVGWEDVCCALWCQCCVLAQMARHTADYEQRTAVCCDDVGVMDWEEDEAYCDEGVGDGIGGEGSALVV